MHLFRDIPYDIVQTSYEGESIWDVSEIDGAAGMMAAAVPTVRTRAAAVRIRVQEAAAVRAVRKLSAMAMRPDTTMVTGPDIMKGIRQAIMMAIRPVIMPVTRMDARAVPDRLHSRAAAVREMQILGAPACLSIV